MGIILTLPSNLTTIESEAFLGLRNVGVIYIPASVISIADDAFDPGVVIAAPEGSYAISWAKANGFAYLDE